MGERLIQSLFDGWDNVMIQSAREGAQGRFHHEGSCAAVCENGDFLFLAGDADAPEWEALLSRLADTGFFYILVSRTQALHERAGRILGQRAAAETRYALKPPEAFDRAHLLQLSQSVPADIELRLFDEDCCYQALSQEWSGDFCSQFASAEDYLAHGLGTAALKNGELVGGASSYLYCSQGIEVQVDVRADQRRRGIAAACGARLILECLNRGLIPEWDAANEASLRLAQKLGYQPAGSYPVWFLNVQATPEKE